MAGKVGRECAPLRQGMCLINDVRKRRIVAVVMINRVQAGRTTGGVVRLSGYVEREMVIQVRTRMLNARTAMKVHG